MESSSSSAKKSKLDDDARTYCDILARCSLPDVAKWKDEDLERAFRWSSYFKQVRKFCNVSIFSYHDIVNKENYLIMRSGAQPVLAPCIADGEV